MKVCGKITDSTKHLDVLSNDWKSIIDDQISFLSLLKFGSLFKRWSLDALVCAETDDRESLNDRILTDDSHLSHNLCCSSTHQIKNLKDVLKFDRSSERPKLIIRNKFGGLSSACRRETGLVARPLDPPTPFRSVTTNLLTVITVRVRRTGQITPGYVGTFPFIRSAEKFPPSFQR